MKETRIPAGAGELLQYLVHHHNDNTIRFILHYPRPIDAGRLAQATLALVRSADVLHSSFHAGALGAHWLVHQDVREADCFTLAQGDDALRCAMQPIPLEARAQLHCTLFLQDEGCTAVVRISHLCADGPDGQYLLYKLMEAYNTPEQLRVKNGSRSATQVYAGLTRKEILSLMRSPLGSVKTAFPFEDEGEGSCRPLPCTIPAEVMAAARTKAKALHASANDLLLAACYHALARTEGIDGHDPLSILGMMDLRKHCPGGDTAGLCNLVGSLSTVLPQGIGAAFEDTLAQVAQQTRAAKEDPLSGLTGMPLLHGAIKALPLFVLNKIVSRVYGSFSVGLTNLGQLDAGRLCAGDMAPAAACFGGPVKYKPAMQVSAVSLNGACTLTVSGAFPRQDADKLQAFLCLMAEEMAAYAAKP